MLTEAILQGKIYIIVAKNNRFCAFCVTVIGIFVDTSDS